jgi:hypothetical protein
VEIRSCKYTEADEEFAMVRLQMFCLLIGSMAFMSVKRQKKVSASLFDQRKQAAAPPKPPPTQRGRRDSDAHTNGEEVEMARIDRETVPLLMENSSNPLEVI